MLPRQRLGFSTPFHRPALRAPAGTRLILWPVVNIEEWEIERPMPRQISPPPGGATGAVPDVPNWAQPAPNFPRLRALALFRRRPPECEAQLSLPASENLHII